MADPQQKEILDLLLNGESSAAAPSGATKQTPTKKAFTSPIVSQPHKATPKGSSRNSGPPQSIASGAASQSLKTYTSGRAKPAATVVEVERGGEWEEYVRMLAEGPGPGAQGGYAMPLSMSVPMYGAGPFVAYNPPMGMGMMGMGMGWGLAPVPLHPYGPPMAVPVGPRPFPEAVAVSAAPAAVPVSSKPQAKPPAAVSVSPAKPAPLPAASQPATPPPAPAPRAEADSPTAPPPVPHVKPKSWAVVATSPAGPAPVPAPTSPVADSPTSGEADAVPVAPASPLAATSASSSATSSSLSPSSGSSAPPLAPAQRAATAAAVKAIADSPAQLVGVNPAPGTFQAHPPHSRQFVIKSFSEDDVHKSIKYGIWASTDNGNRRLDAAYRQAASAQPPMPVYLFFSVNGSGQFCGMAQMTSPLDFTKKADVWAQDKWNGCFTVKWIFIKDIPNNALRHIHLPNNENKPVTNSRDTTEVLQEQGWEVLRVFADYRHKTCLLDDFAYYEQRTAMLREKQQQQQQSKQQAQADSPSAPAPAPAAKGGGRKNRK